MQEDQPEVSDQGLPLFLQSVNGGRMSCAWGPSGTVVFCSLPGEHLCEAAEAPRTRELSSAPVHAESLSKAISHWGCSVSELIVQGC